MKIGILTYHACYNYGANLQAFALQQTLLSWGHDCEIIDYRNKDLQAVNTVLNFDIKYKTDIAFLVFNFIHYFRMRKRKQLFEDFIKNKLKCSRLCGNSEDVFDLSKKINAVTIIKTATHDRTIATIPPADNLRLFFLLKLLFI